MRKSRGAEAARGIPRTAAAAAGTLAFLLLWELTARAIGSEIVLPPPLRVARAAADLFPTTRFLAALEGTFLRGLGAFGITMVTGVAVGLAVGLYPVLASALSPGMTVIRATPVLAVILLALIWFPAGAVPVFAAVLMAFPVVVADVAQGVRAADPGLLEMARLFRLRKKDRIRTIYVPALAPHLASASHGALGLCWKVVVAGEVLSQPARALGTGMQGARIQLETAEVLAWTLAGILLCALTDAAFKLLRRRASRALLPG